MQTKLGKLRPFLSILCRIKEEHFKYCTDWPQRSGRSVCLCCWTWCWCSEWHTWPGEGGPSWLCPAVPAVKHLGEQAGEHKNKSGKVQVQKKKIQWCLGMLKHSILIPFCCKRMNKMLNCAMKEKLTTWCEESSLPICCQCSWKSAAPPPPLSHHPFSGNPTETRTSQQSGTTLDV